METEGIMTVENSQTPRSTEDAESAMSTDDKKTALAAVISFMAVIIALGTIGNLLVILAVIQSKRLHTVSNLFVANLSTCDLMFVTIVLPVNMYTYLGDGWQLPVVVCKFVGFLWYTLTGTTVITITMIAWNRYKLVVDVSRYKRLFRPRNMVLMLAASWVLPMLCLQPAVFETWGHFGYIPVLSSCNLDLDNSSQSFKIFLLIVRAAIPCGLIIYFYSAIYATTRASHQRLHHISHSTSNIMRQNSHRKEMRLTRMMIGIFVVFVLSYFPCTISSVIDWNRMLSKTIHMFCQTSVFLSSAVNPLLYGFMNEQFRSAYYQILTCNIMCRRCKYGSTITRETTCIENNEDKVNAKCETLIYKTYHALPKDKTKLHLILDENISTSPSNSPRLMDNRRDQLFDSAANGVSNISNMYDLGQGDVCNSNQWRVNPDTEVLCKLGSFHNAFIFHNSCI